MHGNVALAWGVVSVDRLLALEDKYRTNTFNIIFVQLAY